MTLSSQPADDRLFFKKYYYNADRSNNSKIVAIYCYIYSVYSSNQEAPTMSMVCMHERVQCTVHFEE